RDRVGVSSTARALQGPGRSRRGYVAIDLLHPETELLVHVVRGSRLVAANMDRLAEIIEGAALLVPALALRVVDGTPEHQDRVFGRCHRRAPRGLRANKALMGAAMIAHRRRLAGVLEAEPCRGLRAPSIAGRPGPFGLLSRDVRV